MVRADLRLKPPFSKRRFPAEKSKPIGTRWDGLDGLLFCGFDLPWPRGTILRVPTEPNPIWLAVVDLKTSSGSPATVCEVVDWHTAQGPSRSDRRSMEARGLPSRSTSHLPFLKRAVGAIPLRYPDASSGVNAHEMQMLGHVRGLVAGVHLQSDVGRVWFHERGRSIRRG